MRGFSWEPTSEDAQRGKNYSEDLKGKLLPVERVESGSKCRRVKPPRKGKHRLVVQRRGAHQRDPSLDLLTLPAPGTRGR